MRKLHTVRHLASAEDRLALERFKPWQPNARNFLAEMLRIYKKKKRDHIETVLVIRRNET